MLVILVYTFQRIFVNYYWRYIYVDRCYTSDLLVFLCCIFYYILSLRGTIFPRLQICKIFVWFSSFYLVYMNKSNECCYWALARHIAVTNWLTCGYMVSQEIIFRQRPTELIIIFKTNFRFPGNSVVASGECNQQLILGGFTTASWKHGITTERAAGGGWLQIVQAAVCAYRQATQNFRKYWYNVTFTKLLDLINYCKFCCYIQLPFRIFLYFFFEILNVNKSIWQYRNKRVICITIDKRRLYYDWLNLKICITLGK